MMRLKRITFLDNSYYDLGRVYTKNLIAYIVKYYVHIQVILSNFYSHQIEFSNFCCIDVDNWKQQSVLSRY